MSNLHVETGSFKVIEEATGKSVECVTDGYCFMPYSDLYGTWEWEMLLGDSANNGYLRFTDTPDLVNIKYTIGYIGTKFVCRDNVGAVWLFYTAVDYITTHTWYKLKMTRTLDGEFTFYSDGSLVDVSGGFGTNPETNTTSTECSFLVFDMDTGDRIRNFRHSIGVEQ